MIQKKLLLIGMLSLVPGAVGAMENYTKNMPPVYTIKLPYLGKCKFTNCELLSLQGHKVVECSGICANQERIELRFGKEGDSCGVRNPNEIGEKDTWYNMNFAIVTKKNQDLLKKIFADTKSRANQTTK